MICRCNQSTESLKKQENDEIVHNIIFVTISIPQLLQLIIEEKYKIIDDFLTALAAVSEINVAYAYV